MNTSRGYCLIILLVAFAVLLAGAASVFVYFKNLPPITKLENYQPTMTSQIISQDKVVIKTFGAYKYKKVTIDDIPDDLKNAIIAIEDKNFYTHRGFDPVALFRSIIKNIKARKLVQGASTITQQLARILFLSTEKTFDRKIKELIIAYRMEKSIPKEKILEMYLNNVYLGEGAYGISAAAAIYFNKKVQDLNLAECALIAGLPQAPSAYTPYRNMDLALKRRKMVLKRMLAENFITPAQADEANEEEIKIDNKNRPNSLNKAPYFVNYALKELSQRANIKEEELVQGGYKVYTTLNYKYQQYATEIISNNITKWGFKEPWEQAALVTYDVITGKILAYIGGKDYSISEFDRVTQAIRPPGSSFKLFVYATALENGATPQSIYPDAPIRIAKWKPHNYGDRYRGDIPLYKALAYSSNVIAARLITEYGISRTIRTTRKLGITTPLERDPTIALGSNGVNLFELTGAYAVFANGGIKVMPYAVERIETADGKIIYQVENKFKRVFSPKVVASMVDMLTQVIKIGTGRAANIGRPAAGKTGTTDSYRDAWFLGFTPEYATGVWIGNDNNTPTKKITGGGLPAIIWREYMKKLVKERPFVDFIYPEIIIDPTLKQNEKVNFEALIDEEYAKMEESSDIFEQQEVELDDFKDSNDFERGFGPNNNIEKEIKDDFDSMPPLPPIENFKGRMNRSGY